MGPLCAASMESGSLHRGYPYLLQLHMLGDIESAAKLCLFQTEQHKQANLDTLLNLWDSRCVVTLIISASLILLYTKIHLSGYYQSKD